jgi:3-deoxy-7-phosphoheptulonate synthase
MTTLITLESQSDLGRVKEDLQGLGLWVQPIFNPAGLAEALTVSAHSNRVTQDKLEAIPGVKDVLTSPSPHPLLDSTSGSITTIQCQGRDDLSFGGSLRAVLAAGPCAAESPEQVSRTAAMVKAAGGSILRGGAFKPRTNPYSFSGHGGEALDWLRDAATDHGLALVTEVMSEDQVDQVASAADMLQIGSRNMQNFALLRAVGETGRPVMLKRGAAATLSEWRQAAEHLLYAGAQNIIFCARGIRGSDPETRNVLDLGGVALLKHVDGHTVFVDPSHAAGRRELIPHLAQAALAAGADGLLVEAHPASGQARSDGPQALNGEELNALGKTVHSGGSK